MQPQALVEEGTVMRRQTNAIDDCQKERFNNAADAIAI